MTIELYGKPACVQCTRSEKRLDSTSANYTKYDVTEDATKLEYVKSLGFLQAPVLVIKDENGNIIDKWGGYNPEKIDTYAAA